MQLPCVKILDIIFWPGLYLNPSLRSGFQGLNFNLKQTKLSKNPGKNKNLVKNPEFSKESMLFKNLLEHYLS